MDVAFAWDVEIGDAVSLEEFLAGWNNYSIYIIVVLHFRQPFKLLQKFENMKEMKNTSV